MALLSFTVTLGAAATPVSEPKVFASFVRIENEAGNALVKFGGSALSATDYAGSVLADTDTVSNAVVLGPHPAMVIALHDLYLLGNAGEKVHIAAITP